MILFWLFAVYLRELPSSHWKIRFLTYHLACCFIRYHHASKNFVFFWVVICRTYKWINFVCFFFLYTVQNEVRPVKHKVTHFISLTPETRLHKLQNQSSKSWTWCQDFISLFQVNFGLLNQHLIISDFRSLVTPFSIKLFNCGLNFAEIIESNRFIWDRF